MECRRRKRWRSAAELSMIGPSLDPPPYDGAAELLWDSIEDLVEASSSREGREAGKELLEDERRFIDLPNSSLFYVREHEIVAS